LLEPGKGKAAAEALMKFLKGDKAKTIIKSFGSVVSQRSSEESELIGLVIWF
jgi:hypothetical protein